MTVNTATTKLINITYENALSIIPAQHEDKVTLIDKLDLEPMKFKLIKEHEWTLERCDHVEKCYKGFLKLILLYPDKVCVPSLDIDEMWHNHVLDTRKYITDCFNIFGAYIHHYPYMGMKDEEDEAKLGESFAETRERYISVLGFDIFGGTQELASCGGGGCGSSCGGGSSCSSGSSCSTHSSCSSHHNNASCGTYIPSSCSSGSCGTSSDEKKKKKEKDKQNNPYEQKKNWWPKLRLDGPQNAQMVWARSVGPADLGHQYRPVRSEVEQLGSSMTKH